MHSHCHSSVVPVHTTRNQNEHTRDGTLAERSAALAGYGFVCTCRRCDSERGADGAEGGGALGVPPIPPTTASPPASAPASSSTTIFEPSPTRPYEMTELPKMVMGPVDSSSSSSSTATSRQVARWELEELGVTEAAEAVLESEQVASQVNRLTEFN